MRRKSATELWMGTGLAVALGLAAAVLLLTGSDAKHIRVALRLTARWSFLLFWLAYAGGAMASLFGPVFAVLARRGRDFGLAFASAHLVHIGLVVWLYWISAQPPLPLTSAVFFGVGVVCIYTLAVLSFGGLARALGARGWRVVRVVGMNYILLAFANDFVGSLTRPHDLWHTLDYALFAGLTAAAGLLALTAALIRRPLAA